MSEDRFGKAYDSVSWKALEKNHRGFGNEIEMVKCVKPVSSALVKVVPTEVFKAGRGLK